MTRCVILGKDGQLGRALSDVSWLDDWQCIALGRDACDLGDLAQIQPALDKYEPDILINAAAYTSVDKAEQEKDAAERINHHAVRALGLYARDKKIPFIHFSTDYVFNGELDRPYREEDRPAPLNVYGWTKLKGEQALQEIGGAFAILRTSWVYSETGINFLRKMLSLASQPELRIVEDQYGAPTYAGDLAEATKCLAQKMQNGAKNAFGLFHAASTGETNWYLFAKEIFRIAAGYGVPSPRINAIPSSAYPAPALRPKNSRLDCGKIAKNCDIVFPHWENALKRCLSKIYERKI